MKEHEHRYVTVVDSHTLDAANTITLKKHKHGYVVLTGHRHVWREYGCYV